MDFDHLNPNEPHEQECRFCHITIRGNTVADFMKKWEPHIASDVHHTNFLKILMLDTGAKNLEELPKKFEEHADDLIEKQNAKEQLKQMENFTPEQITSSRGAVMEEIIIYASILKSKGKSWSDIDKECSRVLKEALSYSRTMVDELD